MRSQMDFDYIRKQMEYRTAVPEPKDSVINQVLETMERANEENAKSAKKQNRITNIVQISVLIITVLTFVSTILFGILGLRS